MRSHVVDLGGPVHYLEEGSGPPIVLVHGLGGAHTNWLAVAPRLAERRRVLVPDLAGFGRTPPAGRSSAVEENAKLLDRFLREVAKEPVTLVGNSMGGLISVLEAGSAPERVRELVLVAPAQPRPSGVPLDPTVALRLGLNAVPLLGEWAMARRGMRLGAEGLVRETLGICCVDVGRVPEAVFQAHIALAADRLERMPWANAAFLEALRSIFAIVLRTSHYRELVGRVSARTLVVHGQCDRLVPVEASRALIRFRPDWKLVELEDTGHVPQLERADRFLEIVTGFLEAPALAQ